MIDPDISTMIDLAEKKQKLMEDFLKLTEKQTQAINDDNFESVLNTINEKQNIMEQINLLDLNNQRNIYEDNETLHLINKNTREMVSRAIALDDQNISALRRNQAQIFEKLKNARQNKTTHSVYRGKNVNLEGILLDKKK